jgi:2-C-methyl-D-erythritol 4-phosphate cytidylyltransferase
LDESRAFIRERLKKLEDLSRDGVDPYPSTFPVTHLAGDLTGRYASADDAALCERLGHAVRVVAGSPWNIKVTTFEDFVLAEALAASGATG